jgi:predicted transcriptional regulator
MDKLNKKRGKFEVVYDILKTIEKNNNSIKPTPLMRASNLSTQYYNEYIQYLKENNLIKELTDNNGRKHITLTDLGFKYLEKYGQILGFFNEFNL